MWKKGDHLMHAYCLLMSSDESGSSKIEDDSDRTRVSLDLMRRLPPTKLLLAALVIPSHQKSPPRSLVANLQLLSLSPSRSELMRMLMVDMDIASDVDPQFASLLSLASDELFNPIELVGPLKEILDNMKTSEHFKRYHDATQRLVVIALMRQLSVYQTFKMEKFREWLDIPFSEIETAARCKLRELARSTCASIIRSKHSISEAGALRTEAFETSCLSCRAVFTSR